MGTQMTQKEKELYHLKGKIRAIKAVCTRLDCELGEAVAIVDKYDGTQRNPNGSKILH